MPLPERGDDERHVVVLLGADGKLADLRGERVGDLTAGCPVALRRNSFSRSSPYSSPLTLRASVTPSVNKASRSPGRRSTWASSVLDVGKEPQNSAPGSQLRDLEPLVDGAHEVRRIVSRVHVPQAMGSEIELGIEERRVPADAVPRYTNRFICAESGAPER